MRGFPIFTLAGILLLVASTWVVACRLVFTQISDFSKPSGSIKERLVWLREWTAKSLLVPMVLWTLMNLNLSFEFQPFMPQIQQAINVSRNWMPVYFQYVAYGWWMILSVWGAFTMGWLIMETWRTLDPGQRKEALRRARRTGLIAAIPLALWLYIGGWHSYFFAVFLLLSAYAASLSVVFRTVVVPPTYAKAIARIKFGKYAEAETEILNQLEASENDFTGWMMLAELYAERFNDLPEAERTVLDLCREPAISPSHAAVALHKLADWHLKLAQDPVSARRVLQRICDRFPGSHLARMATLRIRNIPATREGYLKSLEHKPVRLPHGPEWQQGSGTAER